tara:strand:- start:36 stop:947 length:912 start_codon:yes stop_codon:yes gene_type:complete
MKTKAANIVNLNLPDKQAFAIETKPDFIKLNTLMVLNGKRGGGKTVGLCNFLREAKKENYCDKIIVVTPTYNSNKQIWDLADVQEEDVYEPETGVIRQVLDKCNAEKAEWDQFLEKKELYKQFKKDRKRPVHLIDDENLINYYMFNFWEEPPKWKYDKEQPPRIHIVLDDCLNTPVMSRPKEGLVNLAIRHRHIMDGLGCSLYMLVQSYCSMGGVPRVIRENATHLLLFKINQEKQIQKIIEEADLEIPDEEFYDMMNYCHSEDYQFLMIDFSAKCPTKKYRKGFNEYIIPPSNENKICKCKK